MVKGSDVVTAAVRIQPLDWELSYAVSVEKKTKKQKTKNKKNNGLEALHFFGALAIW